MKKILSILLVLIAFISNAQDPNPLPSISVKKLISPNNPTFYYDQADSSVWVYKGAYGWTKLADSARLQKDYVPYENAWRSVNLDTMSIKTGFVDFAQRENPYRGQYRLFADTTAHTLGFYNDEADITMQIGSEMWSRIYNDSGSDKLNGTVVRITGSEGDIPTINLASNDYHITADGVLGVATHNIESNTYGFVTTIGEVHGLNTSSCPEGAIVYLGVNGAYTHVRPLAPNFVVEIGTCLYSHATDGTILVNIKGSPYDIVHNSFNDIFLESMKFTVTSNGTTTIGNIERNGGGDLTMQFSSGFSTLDCTPAAAVTLTAGTATVPQTNYVYVPKSTGVLTASTSGWPSDEHIKVSEVACRTSALTQTDGVLRNQNWNDHIAGSNGSGHISHINERIRRLNAEWYSGVDPTFTIVSASTPDNLYFSNTGGKVYQMHQQDFPAQSMPTSDIHIVNHFTTPFVTTTNLNTQLTDATGATMESKSYSLVIWGIQNETGELSHLMCNLPIGSYLSAVNAIQDADNYSVYTIPNQFKGVGFLIARVTLSHNPSASGTWTLEQVQDLRGYFPNNTAGSGSSGSGGGVTTYLQLTDTQSSYASSANKILGVNSGETAIESKGVTATLEGAVNIPTGQTYNINGSTIITQTISNGVTTTTSSQDAIYDALAFKENLSNKENTTVDNSTTKYPTVNLLKTYADTKDPSTTNELNSSLTFNTSTNDLTVADAGGNKTANISVNADLLINGYSGTISATANPISFSWPVAYSDTNYYLDIFAHYTETIDGKSVLIRNAVYDFTKTTAGFSLKLDTLAGVVEYRASRTINSETPANVVLKSDSTILFLTPTQLNDSSVNWNTAYVDRLKWNGGSTGLVAAAGRTSLGGTTIGQSMFTLTNPSTITFPRFNADNTITALSADDFKMAIGVTGGTSTATGEIWTALTGTYASATTFTITGTDKDIGLLELSLLTCTDAAGAIRRIGYVKAATNSSGTITINVVTNTDLASGDKDFKIAYNRKVTDYMRLVTIPGEQIADASYSQGMFYADIQSNSYLLPIDLSVQTAASGTGAALTVNVYKNTTALFSSAPDMTTNTVLRSQRPTTNTVSAAETVSLRIMSSAGATNKAANFQAKLYIVPASIYTAF